MNRSARLLATLRFDLPAAVVVFLVAVPLCLGIALASGAPLLSGLVAGIIGGSVVGALSGSPLGVSGPAAGLAVVVLTAIQELGSFEVFLVAVILAGLIQVALGFARAGVIAYYFPSSVITGMLSGIGIVIILKQIPHALGYDKTPEGDFRFTQPDGGNTLSALIKVFDGISPGPLVIAAVALALLVLWESRWVRSQKHLSLVPGSLIAVGAGVLLNLWFVSLAPFALSSTQLVSIPTAESLSGLLAMLAFPDFSALRIGAVYKAAVVLAVVASLETLLCVEATDKLDPLKRVTPTGRELKAQGIGNMISGLLGGLPITQVIVRSSANIQAGGRSKASAIVHGLLLLLSVVVLPRMMNLIPLATLAAILFVVGYKLARPSLFKRMFRQGPGQFVPFAATICGIVFVDLLMGVGLGLAVALVILLFQNFKLPYQIQHLPQAKGKKVLIKLAQNVSFLNKASLLKTLSIIPNGSSVEIDGREAVYVHCDAVEVIDDFVISAHARNIAVVVKGLDAHRADEPSLGGEISVTDPVDQGT